MWYDLVNNRAGEGPHPEYIYNDLDGVDRLLNLPEDALHKDVDKIIQNAASDAVKLAVISPPLIYGKGSGVGNQTSVQLPYLIEAGLSDGYVPVVKPGKTEWDHVDVHSLGDLYVKLVDATQDPSKNNNPEIFGIRGFYFAASGTHSFLQLAEKVVAEIKKQGYSNKVTVKQYSLTELKELKGDNLIIDTYAYSSRGEAQRAKKYLGWEPKGLSLAEGVTETVGILGKAKGL
jgi:nucleoside-diphosphate-sugar epimerase